MGDVDNHLRASPRGTPNGRSPTGSPMDSPRSSPMSSRKDKKSPKPKRKHVVAQLAMMSAQNFGASVGVEYSLHEKMLKTIQKNKNHLDVHIDSHTPEEAIEFVEQNIIGRDLTFQGPYGVRKVVYCDYTASGKSLKFIEDYVTERVLPYYGNTHTTTNVSSLHTSSLRNESKDIIRRCLNCTDEDAVIFVSSGTTGAINKLIHGLKLADKPIVFISPYEHHSNILPWLEIGAEIVYGDEDEIGMVDLVALEDSLKEYAKLGRPMIGSYSAASNITGILTDTDAVSILFHKYGAYAFFDYASAGPYVDIDMNAHLRNPSKGKLCYKDAMFCSIHKFVGGPGTPGLLVAKKAVFINPVPSGAGGGTVVFVTHDTHQYISDIEEREEGGTPAIVESIRAGLVFQLKEEVTANLIMELEHACVQKAYKRWASIKNLYILGKSSADRLPIFSLCIIHPESGRFLHHNFISALLNDLFGIQARGGCACAGPYAEDLLGMSSVHAAKIAEVITGNFNDWDEIGEEDMRRVDGKKFSVLKPGFTRLNLPYFFDRATIDYILEAVAFVAEHGWKMMPMYKMDPFTGDFKYKENFYHEVMTLTDAKMKNLQNTGRITSIYNEPFISYQESLDFAKRKVDKIFKSIMQIPNLEGFDDQFLPDSLNDIMRWFLLPSEVVLYAQNKMPEKKYKPFFFPRGHKQDNPARRTRLKSGSIYAQFCNCPVSNKRHLQNEDCRRHFQKKLQQIGAKKNEPEVKETFRQSMRKKSKKHFEVPAHKANDPRNAVVRFVEENVIGRDLTFHGPYGTRKVVYCDYTASGKSLKFIEEYITDQVLPYYGNTHTTTNVSSLHTSSLRFESKDIIRRSLNCTDQDAVIFVSSGTTGAINKLIHGLKLADKPIVFISPYEHHSNILPWLEIGAEIVYGDEDDTGKVDLIALEDSLKEYSKLGRPMVGSYSAASNITGILTDTDAVSILFHKYGAYAFFDYASAGPYIEIDMNPYLKDESKGKLCYKDAMFCSIHKFVGGPGTPGLLVAKKSVFINPVPCGVGGGTVLFVTHNTHQYVSDIEEREEGGTPAIVESIRAGLVFQLKDEVTADLIMELEHACVERAYKRWEPIKNLYILGKSSAERLPIFSLCIIHPESGRFLHHNFISALLNDLFGVQARGGCACAGPYAEDLLGMSSVNAAKIAEVITGNFEDWEEIGEEDMKKVSGKKFTILKPGFTRLNLPYFFDQETIDYILEAVAIVAQHGWKMLPLYKLDPFTGDCKYKKKFTREVVTLKDAQFKAISYDGVGVQYNQLHRGTAVSYKESLQIGKKKIDEVFASLVTTTNFENDQFLPDSLNHIMRWFLLPSEAVLYAQNKLKGSNYKPFFFPRGHKQENPARRTRLKSGSIYAKFCNCPVSSKRHLQNEDCREYFQKKLQQDRGKNPQKQNANNVHKPSSNGTVIEVNYS